MFETTYRENILILNIDIKNALALFLKFKNKLRIFEGSKLEIYKNREAHLDLCNSYKKTLVLGFYAGFEFCLYIYLLTYIVLKLQCVSIGCSTCYFLQELCFKKL